MTRHGRTLDLAIVGSPTNITAPASIKTRSHHRFDANRPSADLANDGNGHVRGGRMFQISGPTGMTSSLHPHWDFARETRSVLLRFVAFAILLANLLLGGNEGAEGMHALVVVSYIAISIASVATARYLPGRSWLKAFFVVLDALLVALLLYAHILAGPVTENHNLTTTSLVVAFILLVHVGLKLERRLVLIFSSVVLVAWVAMLATTAARHQTGGTLSLLGSFFNQDLGLTVSFGFTAFAIYLLARDHDRTRKEALKADQRRLNLSRFFSPLVVSELQERGGALGLERRNAAIMFVDLRDFTRFAETAPAPELAFVLAEYRQLVSQTIFEHGEIGRAHV